MSDTPIKDQGAITAGALGSVDWSTLPAPEDDGACDHLQGAQLPALSFAATDGTTVELSAMPGAAVIFIYPMTGTPGEALPDGWDFIPGARGCTPQACAFRDLAEDFEAAGVEHLYGLSAQTPLEQKAAAGRLHLPFALLSDAPCKLAGALGLPVFSANGRQLYKRVTLYVRAGIIERVWYPVFPPDANAAAVLGHLRYDADLKPR